MFGEDFPAAESASLDENDSQMVLPILVLKGLFANRKQFANRGE